MNTEAMTVVNTPDNNSLGPIQAGPLIIGFYEDINGPGAAICTNFAPTRHELSIIARGWYSRLMDVRLSWFFVRQSGSYERRLRPYAQARLDRIAAVLGEEEFSNIINDVDEAMKNKIGEQHWKIFTEGTDEEWKMVARETHEKMFAEMQADRQTSEVDRKQTCESLVHEGENELEELFQ